MDSTVKKIDSRNSPTGPQGEIQLVTGKRAAMRLWKEPPGEGRETRRDYETLGYVVEGVAELVVEKQTVRLERGDSWLVPSGARHTYHILEDFHAVEVTSPPAHVGGRDRDT